MRNLFILTTLFFLQIKSNAQNKIRYGIGIDLFQTKLNNVDRETFNGYGHSVPDFTQNDKLGFGLNGLIRIAIYKRLGMETGLGFTRYSSQFHFQYNHFFTQRWVDAKFNIGLYYFKVPFNFYYDFRLSKKSSFNVSCGMNIKLLLWVNDDFEETMIEEIGLPKKSKRYEKIIYGYSGSLSYRYKLNNKNSFELGLHLGSHMNPVVNNHPSYPENFGFYANLRNANYSQYGLCLKYFINH
jgi:hypothetical protein